MRSEQHTVEALLLGRRYLFELFHKAFGGSPSAALLTMLTSGQTLDVIEFYVSEGQATQTIQAIERLSRSLSRVGELRKEPGGFEQIENEYVRFFVGPNSLPAQPFESPYINNELVLFNESTLVTRNAYKDHGWQPKRLYHVPDDHISMLCQFMSCLAAQSLASFRKRDWEICKESLFEQMLFEEKHLDNWLPTFAGLLGQASRAIIYPQLAMGLAAFVELDIAFTGEVFAWMNEQKDKVGLFLSSANAFAAVEASLQRLSEIRLFGLEDYELIALA